MNTNQQPADYRTVLKKCLIVLGASAAASLAQAADSPASSAPPSAKAAPAGNKSKSASAAEAAAPVCKGEFAPSVNLHVAEGKSARLDLLQMQMPAPSWLRAVADPEIVQVEPLTSSAARNMFFVFGKKIGATNLMLQNQEGRCVMVEVSVGIDTAAVQQSLRELMPEEKNLRVRAAADSLVISGTVADAGAVDRALTIANAFVRKHGSGSGSANTQDRIVNMLSIGAPQQVMLEVKIAEISKSLVDKLGVGVNATSGKGNWALSLISSFTTGSSSGIRAEKSNGLLAIDAERRNGLVKILAEPTVMAISGQEGSFLAGGRIFIPVAQDANGKVTLEEKEFGVGLRFTPTVLDGGRINLKVAPEVSELSRDGVGISSTGTGGNAVLPLITTRRAATTVQLFDGQSFAIGGLIKNNVTENIKGMPVFGELPVLGALFRSTDFQTDKTELVFIVTPRLVKPLPAAYPLPTDGFVEPSRKEFFLDGRMEGAAPDVGQTQAAAAGTPVLPTGFELK